MSNTGMQSSSSHSATHKATVDSPSSAKSLTDNPRLKKYLLCLRNFLKLPKARRWLYCEFFYSDIDHEIFCSPHNEFSDLVAEAFPALQTRILRRPEWRVIRRLIGKPRRCSQAFLTEERHALAHKRAKIREILAGILTEIDVSTQESELPAQLPEPLRKNSRVLVRLKEPRDGLFIGAVDGISTGYDAYRIVFEKESINSRVLPDYEVASLDELSFVDTKSLIDRNSRLAASNSAAAASANAAKSSGYRNAVMDTVSAADIMTYSPANSAIFRFTCVQFPLDCTFDQDSTELQISESELSETDCLGRFPTRLLLQLAQLSKLLKTKKRYINQLKEMNSTAERLSVFGTDGYSLKLQQRYAEVLLNLETLNSRLKNVLKRTAELSDVHLLKKSHTGEQSSAGCNPASLKSAVHSASAQMTLQLAKEANVPDCPRMDLIADLTSLLLLVRVASAKPDHLDMDLTKEAQVELARKLDPRNLGAFQDHVEVHTVQLKDRLNELTMASNNTMFAWLGNV